MIIDHIGLGVEDFPRAKAFFDATLAPLGIKVAMTIPAEYTNGRGVIGYGRGQKPEFWISEGTRTSPSLHVAFLAATRADVDAFYRAALLAGGEDNGPPGVRAHYHANYYGAFVRDPEGHNIEAVCHTPA